MKISVCLDALCPKLDAPQAVRLLAAKGVKCVEFWGWKHRDLPALAAACRETGVAVAGICTTCFELTRPEKRQEFLDGVRESIAAAKSIGCKMLITQGGADTGAPRAEQATSILEGLRAAAPLLEDAGVTLALEPLNRRVDHRDAYLESSQEAFALVHAVNSPCVKVLFDIYHQQVSEGDILGRLLPELDAVCHLHAAAVPGRAALLGGELDYPVLLARIAAAGYRGCVGLEYFPKQFTQEGLAADLEEVLHALRGAGLE